MRYQIFKKTQEPSLLLMRSFSELANNMDRLPSLKNTCYFNNFLLTVNCLLLVNIRLLLSGNSFLESHG